LSAIDRDRLVPERPLGNKGEQAVTEQSRVNIGRQALAGKQKSHWPSAGINLCSSPKTRDICHHKIHFN